MHNACRAHEQMRSVFKRGLSLMERKFPILSQRLRISTQKIVQITMVCAGLYNFCKERNLDGVPQTQYVLSDTSDDDSLDSEQDDPEALQYRDNFVLLHFG